MEYDIKDIKLAKEGMLRIEWAEQSMPVHYFMEYDIKDIKLAKEGMLRIEWAEQSMPV
ncbi:MAG: hypothetical protein JRJ15_14870, partial [Deltaproteobacteria bacterium]|nr:hypothetical protein [Deltaproteobacteria bacterium]